MTFLVEKFDIFALLDIACVLGLIYALFTLTKIAESLVINHMKFVLLSLRTLVLFFWIILILTYLPVLNNIITSHKPVLKLVIILVDISMMLSCLYLLSIEKPKNNKNKFKEKIEEIKKSISSLGKTPELSVIKI